MRIKEKFFNISLICVHAPTNESDEHIKDQFYERLENVYKNTPEHDVKLILGDFNAKLGKEACHRPTIGPYSLHDESNENGLRMIDFAGGNNMTISSTYFKHKDIHKMTWASPDGTTKNQIDHVMIDRRHGSDILDVRSLRGADCDTDHFMIRLRYRQRINNAGLSKGKKQLRFDCEKLMKNQNIKRSYQQNLEERLREPLNTENASVEEIWRGIRENIVKTAQETIGYKKRETRNAWMDEECLQALEDRNRARMNMLNRKTRATTNLFQEKRAYARQLCRKKKRDFERSKLEEIMAFAEAKNVRKMYMRIREGKAGFQPRTNFCTDSDGNLVGGEEQVIERWREYFNELLGGIAEEDIQLECNQIGPEPFIEDPQIHEVEEAVESLKNNKAPGEDTITAEMIKAGGPHLLKALHSLIVQIWREEEMPEDWRMAQHTRKNNIIVSGVPLTYKEDMFVVTQAIANVLRVNFHYADINAAHRLQKTKGDTRPPSIVISFTSRCTKSLWLAARRQIGSLSARDLNSSFPNTPVYINEHLTPETKEIFNASRQLMKERILTSVWTTDCKVMAKSGAAQHPFRVHDMSQVKSLREKKAGEAAPPRTEAAPPPPPTRTEDNTTST
ncbi:uncharacterized protein LOC120351088 [Nilaparvata lugens]|uniref:uncharacterized protein LOC120351088 n=1 Tax=Nilaparvata lugens TaxID=108931 RepID=UPI00193D5E14|nr:uncharacterized protein LOC120351088 [Nilaparvata lugens]